jgi:tetratricopeptide (TPR) repeat protein
MTDDLYERYKEALRVGHVAVLRGAPKDAMAAYRAAAAIAPSRALPHTSLGGVLLRLGHLEEALVEYAAAVARAAHDEGALLGQAEALTAAGQRVDAALALDHVSEIQEAAGRLPEAADTLRRALDLEDSPERARRQRSLQREIRLSAGDQAAEQLLARALRLRDEPIDNALGSVRSAMAAAPIPGPTVANPMASGALSNEIPIDRTAPAETNRPLTPAVEPVVADVAQEAVAPATLDTAPAAGPQPVELAAASPERGVELPRDDRATRVAAVDEPATAAGQPEETPAVGVTEGPLDGSLVIGTGGETQHGPTGDELLVAAEAADLAGDSGTLRSLLLQTARAYAHEGRLEAGLDAAHRLLMRDPSDVDAHLVLVELYVARDWNSLATEKLILLGRLAELNNDQETRQRLCAVASRAFPNDERLVALCA